MRISVGVVVSAGLHVLTCTYFMAVVAMSVSARSPAPEGGTVVHAGAPHWQQQNSTARLSIAFHWLATLQEQAWLAWTSALGLVK